ncbi:MAG: asparagine synthase (glutamine-hydrolyzing) [Phycisphaerales bacterium]|nr:asparagine synthase (glutamine-hydrolyzing) [Phycisphaerales bacterium]
MCGILGVLSASPCASRLDESVVVAMRDRLIHRGPDDAGLWSGELGWLGHRRLTVIDPTPGGHQPMRTEDGRYVIVYNGELYNDEELRSELSGLGVRFTVRCDTQTVLHAVAQWGFDAAKKLRGMYALAVVDTQERAVLLGRDPMGIKPLYLSWAGEGDERTLVFASEIPALLAHPRVSCEPDWVVVSAYLSSIRTVLGRRTMFAGIETLEPGEWLRIELDHPEREERRSFWDDWSPRAIGDDGAATTIREGVIDSVRAHLRTDVPMCALLSGGLDSAITTLIARCELGTLRTYCAGAKVEGFDDDFRYARMLAGELGTEHTEVVVDEDDFALSWLSMIERMGVPMSTPNEVAIHAVARGLHADGCVVTLTGEGADELFAGYEPVMMRLHNAIAECGGRELPNPGLFHLESNTWISAENKPGVLLPEVWSNAGYDGPLRERYEHAFGSIAGSGRTDSAMQAHLRFLRRMNLPNLLQRLDTATMLASVEGRTPFADIRIASIAEGLSMASKFTAGETVGTKIALREAFRSELPASIVNRPKQSFPMPFQSWVGAHAGVLRESAFARGVFTPAAIELVASNPERACMFAWPMINLTLWGERWWGDGLAGRLTGLCAAAQ